MFEPSSEQLILKSLLTSAPVGAYLTYVDIEKQTGLKMDSKGRAFLRSAAHSLKLEYRCDHGVGIELESPENAMQIVTGRCKRVSSSLRRADKTTSRMVEKHMAKMPKPERDRLLATASLFGAIQAMAKGLASIYKPKKLNIHPATTPVLPDFSNSKK